MTLTLWRGEQLLGDIRPRVRLPDDDEPTPEDPPTLSGFLIPAQPITLREGIWQVYFPRMPLGVQQLPITFPPRRSGELQPASPEQIAGVPRELQLTVRDGSGGVFLPQQVRLEEVRYGAEQVQVAREQGVPEAFNDGPVWRLFIAYTSASEAPAL